MISRKIGLALPSNNGVGTGNIRTAKRWARLFSEQGHEVSICGPEEEFTCDVLVALNAVKSFPAIERFQRERPEGQLIVAVTGTDLVRNESSEWQQTMAWADRVVVLQQKAFELLGSELQQKAQVILQGARAVPVSGELAPRGFQVCVVGHLREEKDPLRAALASRLLDSEFQTQVVQAGAILESRYLAEVEAERAQNPRYQWLGEVSAREAQELIATSHLMVMSSISEGGPAAVGEAVVAGTPILASRIDGLVGLLGEDYPGYFEVGNTLELSKLLERAEKESEFYQELKLAVENCQEQFAPEVEAEKWSALLGALG